MFWIFESTNIKHQNFPPFYLIKYHKCVIQPDFIVLNRAMRIQTHVFRCLVSRHFSISYNVCYSSSSLTLCITYAQPLWWKARRVPKQTLKIWTQQHLKHAWICIEFHSWNRCFIRIRLYKHNLWHTQNIVMQCICSDSAGW